MNAVRARCSALLAALDDPRHFRRAALAVFLVALLVRLGVFAANYSQWRWHGADLPDQWNELAINLVDHHAFAYFSDPENSSVMRGPIFPLMEVPLYLVFGRNYAGWSLSLLALDTFTCLLLVVTARPLWGARPALLAGLFYACSLPIVYYAALISQVVSVLPFVVLWLNLIERWERDYFNRWLPWVLGLVTGLMILNKTVYLPVPFAATAILYWVNRSKIRSFQHWRPIALHLAVALATVAPWTYRNYLVTRGSFIPVQSMFWELFIEDVLYYDLDQTVGRDRPDHASVDYYLGKEDAIVAAAGLPTSPPPGHRAEWEVQRQKALKQAALEMIRQDPGKIIRVKLANLWHYWVRAENWRKTRIFILLQFLPLSAALAGLVAVLRFRQVGLVKYGLLMIAILWGEHCLVWGWGRLSLDLVPVLALLFGVGFDLWWRGGPAPAAGTSSP